MKFWPIAPGLPVSAGHHLRAPALLWTARGPPRQAARLGRSGIPGRPMPSSGDAAAPCQAHNSIGEVCWALMACVVHEELGILGVWVGEEGGIQGTEPGTP